MRRIDSGNINTLEYREGGGCLSLFGLPFLVGAAFGLYGAFVGGWKTKSGAPAGLIPPLIFCTLFGAAGLVFTLGRAGTVFDKTSGIATKWWGILWFPLWSKTFQLTDVRCVAVSHERRKNKNSSYSVYPVRLRGNSGDVLHLTEPRDDLEARRLAEEIAQFLNLPVRDSSLGETVTRSPEELQESLRDKLLRTNQEVSITAPPASAKSTVSAEGNRVIFNIPPQPQAVGCQAGCTLVMLAIFGTIVASILGPAKVSTGLVVGVVAAIAVVAIAVQIVVAMNTRWEVSADRDGLRVTTIGPVRRHVEEMSAAELEELRVAGRNGDPSSNLRAGLLAISDRKKLRFAEGLSRDELGWMRTLIMKALSS